MSYRWNQSQAALDYDAAGPVIHPRYVEVQDALLAAIPFGCLEDIRIFDLGGGSGRLAERLLDQFPRAELTLVDQSEAFLGIASQRLKRFGVRAQFDCRSMQSDWADAVSPADLVVSTSAIHHLVSEEKLALFKTILDALSPSGVFVNGDEHRPESDEEYQSLLEAWGRHMQSAHASGEIPESFGPLIDNWVARNLDGFGGPQVSGDDCHETISGQVHLLQQVGFTNAEVTWSTDLWAVTVATSP